MALPEFFGCLFIAFGIPFALFVFTIANEPLKVIVLLSSSFFWILSTLVTGLFWLPFQINQSKGLEAKFVGVFISVILQEFFRYLFFFLVGRAANGLRAVTTRDAMASSAVIVNRKVRAYVCSFGFGLVSGIFSSVNFLQAMTGPWTVGLRGDSQNFFLVSAILTLCTILLNTAWGILLFVGLEAPTRRKQISQVCLPIVCHLTFSLLTILNSDQQLTAVTVTVGLAAVVGLTTGVFVRLGGHFRELWPAVTSACRPSVDVAS